MNRAVSGGAPLKLWRKSWQAMNNLPPEYFPILISYISEEVNFLEEIRLQRGVLWGLSRLAPLHPERVKESILL